LSRRGREILSDQPLSRYSDYYADICPPLLLEVKVLPRLVSHYLAITNGRGLNIVDEFFRSNT